jgi:hypothetical protein
VSVASADGSQSDGESYSAVSTSHSVGHLSYMYASFFLDSFPHCLRANVTLNGSFTSCNALVSNSFLAVAQVRFQQISTYIFMHLLGVLTPVARINIVTYPGNAISN